MQTKLTLRLDDTLIRQAKDFAKAHNKSLSLVVSDYFSSLTKKEKQPPITTSITQSLTGILNESLVSEQDYKKYLVSKHP